MKFTQIFIKICLVFTLVSCDSTVTIDTTLPSLTDVYVSSACLNQDDNVVELSEIQRIFSKHFPFPEMGRIQYFYTFFIFEYTFSLLYFLKYTKHVHKTNA